MNSNTSENATLDKLQHDTFKYFLKEANPLNGLIIDKTAPDWPASIAATGLALACYPVSVERGFMTRTAAVERTLATLRFFWASPQGPESDATGFKGFYYHFLDMQTGRRAWQCELSTVDSAFLLAGMLTAALYFDGETADEREIRSSRIVPLSQNRFSFASSRFFKLASTEPSILNCPEYKGSIHDHWCKMDRNIY